MIRNVSSKSARRNAVIAAVVLGIVSLSGGRAWGTTLYATSISGSQIDKVDTAAVSWSLYLNTPSAADSIMFDSSQRIIYDQLFTGQVRRYDPSAATDTLIAGGLSFPADMTLEPGGNSMLVSELRWRQHRSDQFKHQRGHHVALPRRQSRRTGLRRHASVRQSRRSRRRPHGDVRGAD